MGLYPAGTKVCKGAPLFPRYDPKEEIAEAEEEKKAATACPAAKEPFKDESILMISAKMISASAKS